MSLSLAFGPFDSGISCQRETFSLSLLNGFLDAWEGGILSSI